MKRAVLQFTACVLAAGMTVSGTGIAAFAAKDDTLAGFGGAAVQSVSGSEVGDAQESETQTAEEVTEAAQESTEAATEAAQESTEAATEAAQESTETATEAAQESTEAATEAAQESTEQAGVLDTSMSGEQAFAQCEEYINVRKEASADSEVVGKVYNNGSVTILGAIDGWYKVQSGNATGYVNAEYFATGAAAETIAKEVGYNVATVYSDALTVRSQPSEDSEAIGTVYSADQLEVVAYEGDWMKVALGNDVYGYVNAYYVGYDTYYATAETLDEEQARLDQQWTDYLAQQQAEEDRQNQEWQAYLDAQAADASAAEASYQAQSSEVSQAEAAVYDSGSDVQAEATAYDSGSDAQAAADAAYQNYLDAQAAADAATSQADEQQVYDTAAAAQEAYQAYVNAQTAADEAAAGTATEEPTYQETEAAQSYDETPQTEAPSYDYSSTGDAQAAADAAYQAYLEAQAAADAATSQADEQQVYDTAAAAQEAYQAYVNAQAAADAAAAGSYTEETEAPQYEETYVETEAPQYEETEAPQYEETEAPQYEETEAPQTEAPASSTGMAIVNFATQFVGNPYVWGGTSLTNGADCSGFTQSVFANFGISIPRTAAAQASSGTPVDLSEIQAGDLLFYYGDSGIGHVTIYMGNGQVVHASNASTGITISDYGYRTPCSARRYW